jgi:hypothetical protein
MGTSASLAPNTATSRPWRRSASSVTASVRPRHPTASANRHPAPEPATRPASATPRRSPSRGTSARPSRRHEPWKDPPGPPPRRQDRPSRRTLAAGPQHLPAHGIPRLRAFRTPLATAACDGEARSHRQRAPRSPDQVIGSLIARITGLIWPLAHRGTRRRPLAPIRRSARWRVPDCLPLSSLCVARQVCGGLLTISSSSSGHAEHMRIAARPATGRPLFPAAPCAEPGSNRGRAMCGKRVRSGKGGSRAVASDEEVAVPLSRSISLTRQVRRGRLPVEPPGGQGVCWSAR